MRQPYRTNEPSPLFFVIIAALVISIIFTIITKSKQNDVEVYNQSDVVDTMEEEVEDAGLDIPMSIYTDEQLGFSIEIPSDWEEVTKDGHRTFVHGPSASSIQIQTMDYTPMINNVSADTASTEVAEQGKTFTGFTRVDNAHYELMYQDFKNSTYDYIEEVYWDRDNIVKLVCLFNDQNYEKIIPYYEKILNSFAWERANPIPEGYYLYYNDILGFEAGIPSEWTLGAADYAIVATDPVSGSSLTISMIESATYLDSVTATDMANLIKSGKNNFMMKSYDNSKETATVVSTYVVDNVQLINRQYVYADGVRLYFVSFDYQAESIDESIPEECSKLFRSFAQSTAAEEESAGANTSQEYEESERVVGETE